MRRLLLAGLAVLTAGAAPAAALPTEAPPAPVLLSTRTLPASAGGTAPALVVDGAGRVTAGATVAGRTVLWQRGTDGGWTRLPAAGGLLSALPRGPLGGLGVDVAGNLHRTEATDAGVTVLRTPSGGAVDRGSALALPGATSTPLVAVGRYTSGVEGASVTVAAATEAGPVVARSVDGGFSFPQQVPAGVLPDARPAALVVDPADDTRVTVALVRDDVVTTSVSTDSGRTFTRALVATGPGVGLADPALVVVPGGTVLAVPGGDDVLLATPDDPTLRVPSGPVDGVALLAGPSGRLVLAATAVSGAVTLRQSVDGGRTWSAPLVVGDGGDGAPALSGDGSGGVLVGWAGPSGVQVAHAR